jgi:hypothetical protein
MRIHVRPRTGALAAAVLGLLFTAAACDQVQQQLTGAKDQGPVLQSLRQTLNAKRARLSNAILSGQTDFVPGYFSALAPTLDSLEAQAGRMSVMDGQEIRLKVASARRAIQAAQPFVMQNDVEGLKGIQGNLDQVLFDIDGILVRAIAMVDAPAGGP